MINANMKSYTYQIMRNEKNTYGQEVPTLTQATGTIKMSISILSQNVSDDVRFIDCQLVGLTMNKAINERYIITYEGQKYKVLYVNPHGRYRQVFMIRLG